MMKKFKVTFIKVQKVITGQNTPVVLAEQIIYSESDKITIPVPMDYSIMSVTEFLPEITLKNNGSNLSDNSNK